jgi:hypothetical protein
LPHVALINLCLNAVLPGPTLRFLDARKRWQWVRRAYLYMNPLPATPTAEIIPFPTTEQTNGKNGC